MLSLGLATAYGIVRQSGGTITVESESGLGSRFLVYLPRAGRTQAEALAPEPPPAAAGERPRALVVDDEPSIRELVREMLELHGFEVLVASSGREALEVAETATSPVHVLVTDVVMPGLNGRQLARRLRERRPATRVLYISGYSDGAVPDAAALEPGTAFLQKPFRIDALVEHVRRLLS